MCNQFLGCKWVSDRSLKDVDPFFRSDMNIQGQSASWMNGGNKLFTKSLDISLITQIHYCTVM